MLNLRTLMYFFMLILKFKSELNKAFVKNRPPPPADVPGEDVYLCSGFIGKLENK